MQFKYVDYPIVNPLAYELAKWVDEIKYKDKEMSSKMYKMVRKYELLYRKNYVPDPNPYRFPIGMLPLNYIRPNTTPPTGGSSAQDEYNRMLMSAFTPDGVAKTIDASELTAGKMIGGDIIA